MTLPPINTANANIHMYGKHLELDLHRVDRATFDSVPSKEKALTVALAEGDTPFWTKTYKVGRESHKCISVRLYTLEPPAEKVSP